MYDENKEKCPEIWRYENTEIQKGYFENPFPTWWQGVDNIRKPCQAVVSVG